MYNIIIIGFSFRRYGGLGFNVGYGEHIMFIKCLLLAFLIIANIYTYTAILT